ncbi:universal stress protein [Amycolatopsis tolypomycina]|uniref:universal stress protein n=1 Tax=Amycolatopsis tolypomycina TaxID=208445 RepID=UPI0033AA3770
MNTAVVAGFDGTEGSRPAVFWAAAEADRRGSVLVVAHAADWSRLGGCYPETSLAPLSGEADRVRAELDIRTREVVHEVGYSHPDLEVRTVVLEDLPRQALARYAAEVGAHMLVVGPPSGGPFARMVFGSTTSGLAEEAGQPLVVVRGDEPTAGTAGCPVVVGLEQDADNSAALAFSLDFARRHAARVHLVHTRPRRVLHGLTGGAGRETAGPTEAMVAELADWLSAYPDVPFEHEVVRGRPERVLLRRAWRAALLVVGGRRRDSLRRAALQHSPCPVSVVGAWR